MRPAEAAARAVRESVANGADDAVSTFSSMRETMVRFSDNQVTVVDELDSVKGSLYVVVGGRRASVDVAEPSARDVASAVDRAMGAARSSPSGEPRVPLPQGPFDYAPDLLDQGSPRPSPDLMVGWVEEAMDAARREGARRVAGSLIVRRVTSHLETSGAVSATVRKPTFELSVRAFVDAHSSGHGLSVTGRAADMDAAGAGRRAGMLAKRSSEPPGRLEAGSYDAVLGPMVTADVLQQVGRMASAFSVDAGMSFLAGKVGETVAAPCLSVTDDATVAGTYGAMPFDMEGLPTTRTPIVEDGVLRTYLHNSTTASRHGAESTSNAGLVAPRPFNLVVSTGDSSLEEMIADIRRGVYVTNDWYMRYQNYSTGDFSAIPRDAMFLIEDGEIVAPLREMRMSDNVLRIASSIDRLSSSREWVRWWEVEVPVLSPTTLVRSLGLTRSTM